MNNLVSIRQKETIVQSAKNGVFDDIKSLIGTFALKYYFGNTKIEGKDSTKFEVFITTIIYKQEQIPVFELATHTPFDLISFYAQPNIVYLEECISLAYKRHWEINSEMVGDTILSKFPQPDPNFPVLRQTLERDVNVLYRHPLN